MLRKAEHQLTGHHANQGASENLLCRTAGRVEVVDLAARHVWNLALVAID
jgi:hypothetical protein